MANYTLELTYPKAVGTEAAGLDVDNRCYFAYPGLQYRLQVCAIGGDYPYTYTLSNTPAGMAVSATGLITWDNPTTGTYSNIVITVRDAANPANEDSETWSIVVGTAGWYFVDAVSGHASAGNGGSPAGDGTIGNPWLTLDDVYDDAAANGRVYYRTGTYTLANIPTSGAGRALLISWSEASRPVIWLNYPGETPILDFEYVAAARPTIDFTGDNIHIEGFDVRNTYNHAFRNGPAGAGTYRHGSRFINTTFTTTAPGEDGQNSSFLMFRTQTPNWVYGNAIVNCGFSGVDEGTGNSYVKLYATHRLLVHGCTFENSSNSIEVLAIKAHNSQFTVRGNTFAATLTTANAISGNMHGDSQAPDVATTYGELCFNLIHPVGSFAMWLNQDSCALAIYVYRNTILDGIRLWNIDVNDGPFSFTNNVIVNANGANAPFPYCIWANQGAAEGFWTGTPDTSRVTVVTSLTPTGTENLAGATTDNIVDATGALQGSYRTAFLGSWGHEITVSGSSAGRRRHRGFRWRAA